MNLISKISAATILLFSFSSCNAQIKNAKTESVKIYGNCEMCEKTIETAGSVKKIANVDWNKDSKMATITYDSTKTNQDEILKRIALAGYDGDKFLAPDDVYSKLAGCCQYERVNKTAIVSTAVIEDHSMHNQENVVETKQEVNQLKTIFESYFALKDALVKSDGKLVSTLAKDLLANINSVKMEKLSSEEYTVWMKVMSSLKSNTEKIAATTSIEKQRVVFMDLSANFYDLLKVSKQDYSIYYQNCPMYNDGKGANWLSKENAVKNPYYGSQMLTCGKTVETIK
jgi:copper chaperone CopZ